MRQITQVGRGGYKRDTEGPATGAPPGDNRDLGAGRGRKRGDEWTRDTVAESGTQRRAQRRGAEAGGRRG